MPLHYMDAVRKTEGTHIVFINLGTVGMRVTNLYQVFTKDGQLLGNISWFGRWRKYSFTPNATTTYEEVCLREIAEFIEGETQRHRNTRYPRSRR